MKKNTEQLQQELELSKARIAELEAKLQHSQLSFKPITETIDYLELSEIILVALDKQARITLIGGKILESLGYQSNELMGRNWFQVSLPTENYEQAYAVYRNIMAGETENIPYYESEILTKLGEKRYIAWHNSLLTDQAGEITGTLSSGVDITEYKKIENNLQESESRYRLIVETAQEGIWTIDADSNTTFANPVMADMLGYRVEEMQGRSMFDFMDDEGHNIATENVKRRKAGIAEQHDFKFLRKDRSEVWAELNANPWHDVDGVYMGAVALITDITERRRAEIELRNTQKLLLKTESLAKIGSWEWDLLTDQVHWSPEMYRIYQYDPREFTEVNFSLAMSRNHPDDLPKIEDFVKHVLDTGLTTSIESRIILPNGTIRNIRSESTTIENASGQKTHLAGFVQDITGQKKVEEILQRQKEEQQQLINNLADAVVVIDEHGTIQTFSQSAEKMFGYASNEILGLNVNLLMPASIAKQHDTLLAEYLNTGVTHIIGIPREVSAKRKNDETFPVRLTIAELPKTADDVRRFIGVCHDVTVEKQQEEQLRRSQKMDALGKLTGGIAHDYNNLLGIIQGYAEQLNENLTHDINLAGYAQQIHHAAVRGSILTNKLLSFSQHKVFDAAVLDINELLLNHQLMLEKTVTARITLNLDLESSLWPVKVNSSDLEDVIINICINAKQAMTDGGTLVLRTSNEQLNAIESQMLHLKAGEYVLLSITDSGCGMDDTTKERIFDPFFTTKGEQGSGLGLSQVFAFIERSGGAIKVYSELGYGSRFAFYLPRSHQSLSKVSEPLVKTEQNLNGNEALLVVDDEQAIVELIYEILTRRGYRVLTANSGEEALAVLDKESVNLMISDVIMPNMDGFQLANEVQRQHPNVKIQMVSGFADDRHKILADDMLNKNMLYKPFSSNNLLTHVRSLLDEDIKRTELSNKETLSERRILVMDDDEDVRKLFKLNLERYGCKIIEACSGDEAIALYQRSLGNGKPIDAIIVDLNIPGGLGGLEVAKKIRTIDSDVKLIVASGYSEGIEMTHYHDYGFNGAIEKKFDREEMKSVLEEVFFKKS